MTKKIGLYFGSFNPIHIGHLLVATYMREAAGLDEIWFIVSPQNPFKLNSELADEHHRLKMVQLAVEDNVYFKASDIEFHLDKPSYTHITLKALTKQFPEHTFQLIIGEDNVAKFNEWKEAEWILENFKVLVYRRQINNKQYIKEKTHDARLITHDLPMFDISSTTIRERIRDKKDIKYFVKENIENYLRKYSIYT